MSSLMLYKLSCQDATVGICSLALGDNKWMDINYGRRATIIVTQSTK